MQSTNFARKALASLATGAVIVALALIAPTSAAAAAEDTEEAVTATAATETVSADALPTVQIGDGSSARNSDGQGGVVYATEIVGNTVYAGGSFATARPAGSPAGTNEVTRSNFLAFNLTTGNLLPLTANFNGTVRDIAATPDGSKLVVVGNFTQVNGITRNRVAVFDLPSGNLTAFTTPPNINGPVMAVAVTNSIAYIGGYFSAVNNEESVRLGAVRLTTGAIVANFRAWWRDPADATNKKQATIYDQQIQTMAVNPEGTRLVVGGNFTRALYTSAGVNAYSNNPGYGLALFDTATASTTVPLAANAEVRNGNTDGGIMNLKTDGENVYGSGWVYGQTGNVEGSFSFRWADTGINWVEDCHGDTYDIAPVGDVVYSASHKHYCGNSGGFPQENPWTFYHSTAWTKEATGVNKADIYGYPHHAGVAAPGLLNWYPQSVPGFKTGATQAAWSVAGNSQYVVYGGEFLAINGTAQEGLVRYAVRSIAPNKQGPRLTIVQERAAVAAGVSVYDWWAPKISTFIGGSLRVSFPTIFDRDDLDLSYRLYLDSENTAGLVEEWQLSNRFWEGKTLRTLIDGLDPDSTHRVRVVATDPNGNTFKSSWSEATVSNATVSPYLQSVFTDDVLHLWRLGEASGNSVDVAGDSAMTLSGRMNRNQVGALTADADRSIQFNDSFLSSQNNGSGGSSNSESGRNEFSIETWFKTTTTSGGKLVGFGNARTGSSSSYDRHLFMNNAGQLIFGVYPNTVREITTPTSFRDGQWHHAVATLGSEGMQLYVDGVLRATRSDTTNGQGYSGYWRIANDNLGGWSGGSSTQFEGSLDEVAIYGEALPAERVSAHYTAGKTGALPNTPPVATFGVPDVDERTVTVSSQSTDDDGTIASTMWNFGDGSAEVSGANASHTYASPGMYTITLTVTDDDGATDSTTRDVTVTNNAAPTAVIATPTINGLAVNVSGSATDSDGTIASYSWDFGDGSAAKPGATASHTYTDGGDYTITLTVTDNKGATGTDTRQVTVTAPANVPPTASIANPTISGLDVDVVGSGVDSDGTIASYSWNFGDGSAAVLGAAAAHTYPEGGVFTITLTVTDNAGATGAATRQVSVIEPTTGALASDSFDRTTSNGWGSADLGGAWTVRGGTTLFSVGSGAGKISQPTSRALTTYADLNSVSATAARVDAVFSLDKIVEGQYVGVIGRRVGSDFYAVRIKSEAGGTVRLFLLQTNGAIGSSFVVPGLTLTAGDKYVLSVEVTGTGPTSVKGKIWKQGTTEPDWQRTGTNTFAGLQSAGAVSLLAYTPNTPTPAVVSFDSVKAVDPAALPPVDPENQQPTAAIAVPTVNGLSVDLSGSGSDTDGTITSYAWNFGDGTSGNQPSVTKTYATGGTYTVTLTVTDNDGATGTATRSVTVSDPVEPGAGVLAEDEFERTASNSWGTATVGGAWTLRGGTNRFSVSGGAGKITLPAGQAVTAYADLNEISSTSTRVEAVFSLDRIVEGQYVGVIGRKVGADFYAARIKVEAGGAVRLFLLQTSGAVGSSLLLPGLTLTAGDKYVLSVEVTGSGPTSVKGKIWKQSEVEPDWQRSGTNTFAGLQSAGAASVFSFGPNLATGVGVASFDSIRVTDPSVAP
ncbi:PKD domain-containing protein [uncultured Microbacterium sp.]|uniref:Putative PDK repeat-containing protein n=1 Tax=uncultured Microbacterium sp. TaxID=191216 RepID=A0A1Y5NXV4_9MICO|nr:PKD domain-containing protein [uncultured Microbacterium sp.]SBS71213.1 putative PDK repeat-containing protein [uncultured Microbacterium sp.]